MTQEEFLTEIDLASFDVGTDDDGRAHVADCFQVVDLLPSESGGHAATAVDIEHWGHLVRISVDVSDRFTVTQITTLH